MTTVGAPSPWRAPPSPTRRVLQFFIVLDDGARRALDQYRTYVIFGNVVSGMDVVDKIAAMPNGGGQAGKALDPVVMQSVTIRAPGLSTALVSLDGTWTVDSSIGSFNYAAEDFSGSWAGYRVQEQLVGIGESTAVGRTPDMTGTMTLAGTQVTRANLSVGLTTLVSDQPQRDVQLARQGIETDRFPTATFTLVQPVELGHIPADGEEISATAIGNLTLHGVTRGVRVPLKAKLTGDVIGIAGSITFGWKDFDMEKPSSPLVVSLGDTLTLELQAFLRKNDSLQSSTPTPVATPGPSPSPEPTARFDRVLVVRYSDSFTMTPDAMTVTVGVPVLFKVTNPGTVRHAFFVGTDLEMRQRESGMAEPGPKRFIQVLPGATVGLMLTFTEPAELVAGDPVPGHYSHGERATLLVRAPDATATPTPTSVPTPSPPTPS